MPSGPRILIVKLSAVGDVVHTLPALNALRASFPDATIGWVAHPGPASLLDGHPQIDRLILMPRRFGRENFTTHFRQFRDELRSVAGGWDAAIDFQGLTKSGVIAWLSKARKRIGFAGAASRELNRFFTTDRVKPAAREVIRMNLELLAPLGVKAERADAVLHHHIEDENRVRAWAADAGLGKERFLVLDPFAGWVTKVWPRDRWAEVARRAQKEFGVRPLVFFGPGERHEAEVLAAGIRAVGADPIVAPDMTLRQYVALLKLHAGAFAGGDTGPMHIAAALGIPTVALFGTSDSRRNSPVFSNARFEVLQDFSQPCAGTFARNCRHHAPGECLRGIPTTWVVEALGRLLDKPIH
jgi:lipopolysaccharide heptosyltransferase I